VARANDTQIGGTHYKKKKEIQHWDYCADMPYLEARCIAYIDRHWDKNGIQDLEKALHFIQKILETRYDASLNWNVVSTNDMSSEDDVEIPREYANPDCGAQEAKNVGGADSARNSY